jgi:hypothetical protein
MSLNPSSNLTNNDLHKVHLVQSSSKSIPNITKINASYYEQFMTKFTNQDYHNFNMIELNNNKSDIIKII